MRIDEAYSMEMFSGTKRKTEKDPGRPERPFPLGPQPGLHSESLPDGGFPVRDETDFILMSANNISWGHAVFEILKSGAVGAIGG